MAKTNMRNVSSIEAHDLQKAFQVGNKLDTVLNGISWKFPANKLTFITGPNGVGKTVFAKCICGLEPFDSGYIVYKGKQYTSFDRSLSKYLGIEYIPQILPQPKNITGCEFLSLTYPRRSLFFWPRKIQKKVENIYKKYNLEFNLNLKEYVSNLRPADLQRLYLIRVLLATPNILILDEPTALLGEKDSVDLGKVLNILIKEGGITIIAIAHPYQYRLPTSNVLFMTRDRFFLYNDNAAKKTISVGPESERLSFPLKRNIQIILDEEAPLNISSSGIVSISGVPSREFYALGERLRTFDPTVIKLEPPGESSSLRKRYVPANAVRRCLAEDLTLLENCLIGHWNQKKWKHPFGFIAKSKVKEFLAEPIISELVIEPSELKTPITHLSGGNRQRLVISRECFDDFDLLIAVDLFRGLDDDGIRRVCQLLEEKVADGVAVILICSTKRPAEDIADYRLFFEENKLRRKESDSD